MTGSDVLLLIFGLIGILGFGTCIVLAVWLCLPQKWNLVTWLGRHDNCACAGCVRKMFKQKMESKLYSAKYTHYREVEREIQKMVDDWEKS